MVIREDEEMKTGKPQLPTETSTIAEASPSYLAPASARRAKIICTIGPACHSEAAMRDLLRLGIDVARRNFSHGTHDEHARNNEHLRRTAEQEDRTVCI